MKVLYLTKYSRKGASSRLRSYQYFPFLENEGFDITVKPLFNDYYLDKLYQGKYSILNIVKSYSKRLFILFTLKKYNNIVIEKELFPYVPSLFEGLLNILNVKYIVDYDDAIFHNYDLSKHKIVRFLLKHKIDSVMKWSSCVIVGNSYLAERAKNAGAKKIEIIPTIINTEVYSYKEKSKQKKFIIGWIGSPSTFKYVKQIEDVLKKIINMYPVEVHIIGATGKLDISINVQYIVWNEKTEIEQIQQFDVGIMPLESSPWELGKCSYKLIQYMGCGIPVIASPVGMNNDVVRHNWNGFLVENDEDWVGSLEKLILNNTLKKYLGGNGRKFVEENYSIHKLIENYKSLIFMD